MESFISSVSSQEEVGEMRCNNNEQVVVHPRRLTQVFINEGEGELEEEEEEKRSNFRFHSLR